MLQHIDACCFLDKSLHGENRAGFPIQGRCTVGSEHWGNSEEQRQVMGLQCPVPKAELPAEWLLGMQPLLACLLGSSAVSIKMPILNYL